MKRTNITDAVKQWKPQTTCGGNQKPASKLQKPQDAKPGGSQKPR